MAKRESNESFVVWGVVLIVCLLMILILKFLFYSVDKIKERREAESPIPYAKVIGMGGDGYEIYEFIDPKTNQRCLLYRHSIVVIPEKKD